MLECDDDWVSEWVNQQVNMSVGDLLCQQVNDSEWKSDWNS